ncbi:uncharacterized protein C8R40DRAFT_1168653 [Lentinula edodes]|uniref:uncharacterized protein n=1 Tax=Lentinula edodes TaxID=5353 RepID=UPI001E8E29F6|nr:uncharacterized protein C8R40DRAFT_1168653 [Lentinula edodes]KAH7877313.1 hypothetical protein C8R40DRAFT_1168653 [Lentinula edodes]KAJ3916249.1 hypothetical protein F5877DRAFT_81074 [Lentinula edodes]
MGPQRAARRSVATRHHPHRIPEVSVRQHRMLTRSMAQVHPAPAFTRMNGSSSYPEASTSALDTDSNPPHCPSSPFSENLITAPLYSHVTQCRTLHEASSSSLVSNANFSLSLLPDTSSLEASSSSRVLNANLSLLQDSPSLEAHNPPSTVNTTSSDLSSEVRTSMGELPSKPGIPVELLTNSDQRFVTDLELFDTRSRRLFNEQKNSLEFAEKCIEVLVQQCIDLRKINDLKRSIRKLELCCSFCNDLAWNPHVFSPDLFLLLSPVSFGSKERPVYGLKLDLFVSPSSVEGCSSTMYATSSNCNSIANIDKAQAARYWIRRTTTEEEIGMYSGERKLVAS